MGRLRWCAALLLAALALSAQADEFGRSVFHEGRGADGSALSAYVGDPSSAQSIPLANAGGTACIGCHMALPQAAREGNAGAPLLSAATLKAVSVQAFARAVNQGRGFDGRMLDRAMPRYRLTPQELAHTLAYLQSGSDTAAAPVTLVTLLPIESQALAVERDALAGLRLCAEQMDGAVQRPTLRVERFSTPQEAARIWRELIADPQVVAVIAPSLRGWQDVFATTFAGPNIELPIVVFPLVDDPIDMPQHDKVHWLFGGQTERQAAVDAVRRRADAQAATYKAQSWRAAPARQSPVQGAVQSLGQQWAEASCTTLATVLRGARVTQRDDFARAWRRIDAVDTASGFRLRPARRHAVNAWAVFHRTADGPWRLADPQVEVDER